MKFVAVLRRGGFLGDNVGLSDETTLWFLKRSSWVESVRLVTGLKGLHEGAESRE